MMFLKGRAYSAKAEGSNGQIERQIEFEESMLQNPLTRGVWIKPIKIVKALLGIPCIYGALSSSRSILPSRFPSSPERGLGNILRERTPRNWVLRISVSPERSSSLVPSSLLSSLPEIAQYLYPCLCVGSALWLSSLSELSEFLQQSPAVLDISVLREAVNLSSQEGIGGSAAIDLVQSSELVQLGKGEVTVPYDDLSQNEYKSAKAIALVVGSIVLAILLTGAVAKLNGYS